MRLTFPNGEHAAVNIEQGQVGVGSAAGGGTSVTVSGLAPLHAVFAHGRRGSWLTVPNGATVVLNARPVKRIAYLRAGDLVCLNALQVRVESTDPPPPAPAPLVAAKRPAPDDAQAANRVVLRGLSGVWFGRSIPIVGPRQLGRGHGVDVRLEGPEVKERHAVIEVEGGVVVVRAGVPSASLRVNGHLVASARLAAGDQLEIGPHRFTIEAPGLSSSDADGAGTTRRDPITPTALPTLAVAKEAKEPVPVRRDLSGVYLLVAAAAALAAALMAFLVYAPRG